MKHYGRGNDITLFARVLGVCIECREFNARPNSVYCVTCDEMLDPQHQQHVLERKHQQEPTPEQATAEWRARLSAKLIQTDPDGLNLPLTERFNIRCSKQDLDVWKRSAEDAGFDSIGSWLRAVANRKIKP